MSSILPKLPADLSKRLADELAPGERVLYAAKPDWRAETGSLFVIFLFATFFTAIALLFFAMSAASLLGISPMLNDGKPAGIGLQLFFFLFSMPFVVAGCGLMSLPFLGIRKARNTVHAVTNARLINVYGGKDAGIESYKLATINFVRRRDRRNGTGSLSIGYGIEKDSDGDPRPLTTDWSGIPDAKRAEAIIYYQVKWVR